VRRANRGFLQFLLSNPLLLLSAALGVALFFTGLALKYQQHKAEKALERAVTAEATVEQMIQTAKQVADANERIRESWRLALVRNKADGVNERAALVAQLERMRGAPRDPTGSAIPVTSCPGTPDVVPAEYVSLREYEALQERAALDALQLLELQDYVIVITAPK